MGRFDFKQFSVDDYGCGMKVGTDSVLLGAWTETYDARKVLDMGTGSGLLALMMAQKLPNAQITAVEIDLGACEVARRNIDASPWPGHIEVVAGDIMAYPTDVKYDLIITNPPYFTDSLNSPDLQRNQARHSAGGFGPISSLVAAKSLLSGHGTLSMIAPIEYEDELTYQCTLHRLYPQRICHVSPKEGRAPTRLMLQVGKQAGIPTKSTKLIIRDRNNIYTEQYVLLTQDYYLHL